LRFAAHALRRLSFTFSPDDKGLAREWPKPHCSPSPITGKICRGGRQELPQQGQCEDHA
jgi:hypothetical protein